MSQPTFYHLAKILSSVPTSPLTATKDRLLEGYWTDGSKNSPYPKIYCAFSKVDPVFLFMLKGLMKKGREQAEATDTKVYFLAVRGMARCQLCGEIDNAGTFYFERDGYKFCMPANMLHFYEDHNVHPSPEFKAFVLEA